LPGGEFFCRRKNGGSLLRERREPLDTKVKEIPVVWLQCATCTGCLISILNTVSPTIKNVLIDPVVPGKHVNLRFNTTVMAGAGDLAMEVAEETARKEKGGYL
jgi:Ni,Fe-hydrogenase I small subunit